MAEEKKATEEDVKKPRPFVGNQNDIEALEAEVAEEEHKRRVAAGLEEENPDETKPEEEPKDPEVAPTEPPKETKEVEPKAPEEDPEEETWKERYANLRRWADKEMNTLKTQVSELQEQKNELAREGMKMPKSEDEIKEWSKKNPDAWAIISSIALQSVKGMSEVADKRLEKVERQAAEVQRREALMTIRESHPDFDELAKDKKFHEWAKEQPQWIFDALYKNNTDPYACIRAVDLYKHDIGVVAEKKKSTEEKKKTTSDQKKSAAETTGNTRGSTPTDRDTPEYEYSESQIERMQPREFEAQADKIEKAYRSGKVLYDLTGAAQ